jgi:hypothetical protein
MTLRNTAIFLAGTWAELEAWRDKALALRGDELHDHLVMGWPMVQDPPHRGRTEGGTGETCCGTGMAKEVTDEQ